MFNPSRIDPNKFIAAAEVFPYVTRLREEAGLDCRQIAEKAGVSGDRVRRVARGEQKLIRAGDAVRLLAVPLVNDEPDKVRVPAGPTVAHTKKLLASGWTGAAIARKVPLARYCKDNVQTMLTRNQLTVLKVVEAAILALEPLPADADPSEISKVFVPRPEMKPRCTVCKPADPIGCDTCRDFRRSQERFSAWHRRRGYFPKRVRATKVRARLLELRSQKITFTTITAAINEQIDRDKPVGINTLSRIAHGRATHVDPLVADAVLNLKLDPRMAGYVRREDDVPALATQRRVQGMMAQGIPAEYIGKLAGRTGSSITSLLRGSTVNQHNHDLIERIADKLVDYDIADSRQPWMSRYTARIAAERSWKKLTYWVELEQATGQSIDEPDESEIPFEPYLVDEVAVEQVLGGRCEQPLTRAERSEIVRRGTDRGMTASHLARLINLDARHVQGYRSQMAYAYKLLIDNPDWGSERCDFTRYAAELKDWLAKFRRDRTKLAGNRIVDTVGLLAFQDEPMGFGLTNQEIGRRLDLYPVQVLRLKRLIYARGAGSAHHPNGGTTA